MAFLDNTGVSRLVSKIQDKIVECQPKLISGENIKTINNTTILGSGNITVATPMAYTLIGTNTGTSKVTISANNLPSEVYVEVYTGSHSAMYSGTFLTEGMTSGTLNIGGYYMSATDYGLCNLNITKTSRGNFEVAIRNHVYGGTTYTTTATIKVWGRF